MRGQTLGTPVDDFMPYRRIVGTILDGGIRWQSRSTRSPSAEVIDLRGHDDVRSHAQVIADAREGGLGTSLRPGEVSLEGIGLANLTDRDFLI